MTATNIWRWTNAVRAHCSIRSLSGTAFQRQERQQPRTTASCRRRSARSNNSIASTKFRADPPIRRYITSLACRIERDVVHRCCDHLVEMPIVPPVVGRPPAVLAHLSARQGLYFAEQVTGSKGSPPPRRRGHRRTDGRHSRPRRSGRGRHGHSVGVVSHGVRRDSARPRCPSRGRRHRQRGD
jgi:hypothetical protein